MGEAWQSPSIVAPGGTMPDVPCRKNTASPMNKAIVCKRCFVSGRVQGVFFRASTYQQAKQRGVTGWAHNLLDGRVEVLACGPEDAVEALCTWLWKGPPAAHVEAVECAIVEVEPPPVFGAR